MFPVATLASPFPTCAQEGAAGRTTVSGETLVYYQDPVSPSQLNRGDLNHQAETHTYHFLIIGRRLTYSFLFTELCKTHSWSHSWATSKGLRKHSPADHLGLWSMIFYSWLFFFFFAFLWYSKTKMCFRQLNVLGFVRGGSTYPKKISLHLCSQNINFVLLICR